MILQDCLAPGVELAKADGIAPLDPVAAVAEEVQDWPDDTMLVGHLPLMAKLVSRLISGDENTPLVEFTPGSVVCLERPETGGWVMAWIVGPELVSA